VGDKVTIQWKDRLKGEPVMDGDKDALYEEVVEVYEVWKKNKETGQKEVIHVMYGETTWRYKGVTHDEREKRNT
jgi:hypothetical protein